MTAYLAMCEYKNPLECEGEIEKSVPKITNWHQEACPATTNGGRKGQIFLSHPYK